MCIYIYIFTFIYTYIHICIYMYIYIDHRPKYGSPYMQYLRTHVSGHECLFVRVHELLYACLPYVIYIIATDGSHI